MIIFRGFMLLLAGGGVIAYLVYIGRIKPYWGIVSRTNKGERVKSKSEKRIADYLYSKGVR